MSLAGGRLRWGGDVARAGCPVTCKLGVAMWAAAIVPEAGPASGVGEILRSYSGAPIPVDKLMTLER
jgi:hypothetical protein